MNKKRSYNASIMNTNDTLFDLSGSVFAVVSLFMGKLYVHIRVFSNNKYPTKMASLCQQVSGKHS